MTDHVLVARDEAPDRRHQPRRDGAALVGCQALIHGAAEGRYVLGLLGQPGGGHVDDLDRRVIAGARGVAPGEQSVAFQDDAIGFRVLAAKGFQPEPQLVSRPLPGQPADPVSEDLARQVLRVCRRGNCNDRVGMNVIDMLSRNIGVQRRVDRGRARVQPEGAMGQVSHHLILVLDAAIKRLQGLQLVHVERGEAVLLHRADIAARALDPQHLDRFAGQGVGLHHLGRGVAAAVIRHALVGAKDVRAIEQEVRFAHALGAGVIPAVLKKLILERFQHAVLPMNDRRPGYSFRERLRGVRRNVNHVQSITIMLHRRMIGNDCL